MNTAQVDKPDYKRAEREALSLLAEFGIEEPPVDPAEIARQLGVNVYFVEFSTPILKTVSGFYDADERAIFVNRDEYALRQTFTIAHELGHHILHKDYVNSQEYRVLLRDDNGSQTDPREKEANAFAANLLVPLWMLDKYRKGLTTPQLSTLFAVSCPVITNRLKLASGTK